MKKFNPHFIYDWVFKATNTDGQLGEAVSLQTFYDVATNAGNESESQQTFALHSVGRLSREQAKELLQSKGSLPGDFLIRDSKDKHVLTLVKPNGTVCHHAMAPAERGKFVLNGKTKVAARSLAGLLQKWLDAPEAASRILGAELALHAHWSESANPYYSLAVSSNPSPHYALAASSVVNFSNAPHRTPSADLNEHTGARPVSMLMGFDDFSVNA